MTGIKATKIIQNLQFVNSFGLSSLAFFLFWFFRFANWVRSIPLPPACGEGAVAQKSLGCPQLGPSFQEGRYYGGTAGI